MATNKGKGWSVVLGGTGINLALGILYTWSIFKAAIVMSIEAGGEGAFAWDAAAVNDPYAVAVLVFALSTVVAGRLQDRFGPRITAIIGGLLVGAGFLLVSQSVSYVMWIVGFGVLAGMGIGFGYAAATPPALKWFPPAKTGMIAGIVVSGFGLASVYIAPLAKYLLGAYGLQSAMMFFGIAFAIVVAGFALLLRNPPAGYVADPEAAAKAAAAKTTAPVSNDMTPSQMLKTPMFWIMWGVYFIGAGAGLMVIGSVAGMAKASLGEAAFVAVAIMAIGNAGGRIVAGILSDKLGRMRTLFIMLLFQAVLMFLAIPVVGSGEASATLLVLLATFIGFNYGTNLALFPAITKDFWGLRTFGSNYGILFTAWGVGGFVLSRLSQMLKESTGSFSVSFAVAGALLAGAAGVALAVGELSRARARKAAQVESKA